jgi:hypothetical protein
MQSTDVGTKNSVNRVPFQLDYKEAHISLHQTFKLKP